MGSPVEETNPEFVFERFDLKCDRGLGKEKAFRSLAKIQMLSDGAKDLETKVFELRHVMIIHGNAPAGESILSHPLSGPSTDDERTSCKQIGARRATLIHPQDGNSSSKPGLSSGRRINPPAGSSDFLDD